MEGALGTTEMRRTLPTGRPDRIETYKQEAVGRYVTAEGLYDVKTAYGDLVKAGISNEVATNLAKQGLEANTIFSMADDLAEKSRKSQVAVAGSIANLALHAHAANPTVSLEDTVKSLQGPSGNRIPQDQLDKFEVAFFGKSPQEQESILRSMVQQWDAQGKGQAFAPGTIVRGEFSGNQEQVGIVPVSAADSRESERKEAYRRAVANGYDGTRDKFEAEQARGPASLPTSIQEYEFAVKQGYKKSFEQWSIEDANRRRQAAGNSAEVSPTALLNATMSLRTQVSRETNASRLVDVQLANMEASLKAVKGDADAAGSQGVLTTFQKILDPLSVVRESEYARSAQGLSLLAAIQGKYDLYMEGGAGVPVKELEKFVALARQFAQNQRNSNAVTMESVSSIVEQYKINPKSVFGNGAPTPKAEPNISNGGGGQIGAQGNAAVAPGGRGVPPPSTNRIRIVNLKDRSTGTILASDAIPPGYRKQ
jgi:hypothetical protein